MSSICTSDLRQLEMRIPTVVFRASDAAGNDLSDVRVSERDRVLVEALDGRAVDVDPGPRTFRFTRGGASSEASVLVIEGEKARAVSVVLHVPPRAAPPREPGARAAGGNVGERVTPWWVYAAGGASLVTTSLFAGFGISGLKRRSELDACLGACDQGAVDRAKSDFLTADVFLGASLLGYGITLTLFLLRPTVATPQAPRTTAFDRLGTF